MLYINIDQNIINKLRNRLFYKYKPFLFISKELRHRKEVKKTYNRTVLNINKNKIDRLVFKTKNKNFNYTDTFKTNIAVNITVVIIVTIYNV